MEESLYTCVDSALGIFITRGKKGGCEYNRRVQITNWAGRFQNGETVRGGFRLDPRDI